MRTLSIVSTKSELALAIRYASRAGRIDPLSDDGRIEIDNNAGALLRAVALAARITLRWSDAGGDVPPSTV